ncbi:16146_t:CDS:2 [Funneliformis geosporum]|uniref:19085_t:CDS:1 n=1 Tax=Funneliformis geosporum TaxID=1117311 RepID=A0A9W4SVA4_9GLOM|nr:19085_t:CDS:2 [Funneliformis geosporum]CAI2182087.1 16146_t:CDS:2 [Funneliformis geosporum]
MLYLFDKKLWAILYAISWSALFVVLPQPSYQGPTKIIELSEQDLNEIKRGGYELHKFKEITDEEHDKIKKSENGKGKEQVDQHWIIFFHVTWSPVCRTFESTVAKTSVKYTTTDVHFGKIDLDFYPNLAQEYEISLSPTSLDLPALIYFKNGRENARLPKSFKDGDDVQLDQIKNKTLKSAKVTWDRLGWDRSMKSIITAFKLDTISKTL